MEMSTSIGSIKIDLTELNEHPHFARGDRSFKPSRNHSDLLVNRRKATPFCLHYSKKKGVERTGLKGGGIFEGRLKNYIQTSTLRRKEK